MQPTAKLLIGAAIAFLGWIGVAGCADDGARAVPLPADGSSATIAKPLHLIDLDGRSVDLWPAGQNRVTVVVFTRSDCPISNRYAPEIRRLYDEFHPRAVDFYLIYVDPHEEPSAIREHLRQYEYPCPALRDPEHVLVAATGATVTPEAAVFAADRKMIYRGRIDDRNADFGKSAPEAAKHDLADAIEAALAGKPVAEAVTKAVGCYIGDVD
jgi:cytochrome oxidase Cu insertion factor (SCO1/SenC/PrrC family)